MSDESHRARTSSSVRPGFLSVVRRPRRLRRMAAAARPRLVAATGLPAVLAVSGMVPMIIAGATGPQTARVPSSILCQGYSGCDGRGYASHAYGPHSGASYWRMSAGDECTNYVAYVESVVYHVRTPGYLLGDAGQWPETARAHGVAVNNVPAVGAVAEWNDGAPGIGGAGHVAVVEKVGPRDRYIVISQQHMSSDVDGYDWTRINAGFTATQWQEWPDNFIHFPVRNRGAVGYFDPRTGSFRVRTSSDPGPASFGYSVAVRGVVPLTGDWSGADQDGIGYYNPRYAWFHLRDTSGAGRSNYSFRFGPRNMIPIVGNWTSRRKDGIGYYDPHNGTFHLRNSLTTGKASRTFRFGPPDMTPLVGNWAGGRKDGIGYYDPRNATFHLRNSLTAGKASSTFTFGPGGMIPLAGDWIGV